MPRQLAGASQSPKVNEKPSLEDVSTRADAMNLITTPSCRFAAVFETVG